MIVVDQQKCMGWNKHKIIISIQIFSDNKRNCIFCVVFTVHIDVFGIIHQWHIWLPNTSAASKKRMKKKTQEESQSSWLQCCTVRWTNKYDLLTPSFREFVKYAFTLSAHIHSAIVLVWCGFALNQQFSFNLNT